MAYVCRTCIAEHGLEPLIGVSPAGALGCIAPCEVCTSIFFTGWLPEYRHNSQTCVWVSDLRRSLDDPEAIPRQLGEWAACRFLLRLAALARAG